MVACIAAGCAPLFDGGNSERPAAPRNGQIQHLGQLPPPATRQPNARWWPLFLTACLVCGFAWAITLLTYLLPPAEIWGNLWHGTLTANQMRFLAIGTLVFTLEFTWRGTCFADLAARWACFKAWPGWPTPGHGRLVRQRPGP